MSVRSYAVRIRPTWSACARWPDGGADRRQDAVEFRLGVIHLAPAGRPASFIRAATGSTPVSLLLDPAPWAINPTPHDLGELGRYHGAHWTLTEHWRAVLPDSVMLEVQHQVVVADLDGQARRIVACELSYLSGISRLVAGGADRDLRSSSPTDLSRLGPARPPLRGRALKNCFTLST